jgi:hypothetical protein
MFKIENHIGFVKQECKKKIFEDKFETDQMDNYYLQFNWNLKYLNFDN